MKRIIVFAALVVCSPLAAAAQAPRVPEAGEGVHALPSDEKEAVNFSFEMSPLIRRSSASSDMRFSEIAAPPETVGVYVVAEKGAASLRAGLVRFRPKRDLRIANEERYQGPKKALALSLGIRF